MMYTLIDPEEVTIKRLVSAFQNAFIRIRHVDEEENELFITLENDDVTIKLSSGRNCLSIFMIIKFQVKSIDRQVENAFFRELNWIQRQYLMTRFYAKFAEEDEKKNLFIFHSYEKAYDFSLNIPELIDNARTLVKIHHSAMKEVYNYLENQNILL